MCLHPYTIKNTNYINRKIEGNEYNRNDLRFYKEHRNSYIEVPCGWCSECIAVRQMGYIQRIMEESRTHHIFMIMYSYNEEMIPKYEINGYTFKYADIQDFVLMTKRLRKWKKTKPKNRTWLPWDFTYFGVTELGGKKGRPH